MTSPPTASPGRFPAGSAAFPHRHLLGIAGLQPWEIEFILAEAEQWVALNRSGAAKRDDRLRGLTIINAFFENSTRTLLSFEIAGKRLGAASSSGARRSLRMLLKRWFGLSLRSVTSPIAKRLFRSRTILNSFRSGAISHAPSPIPRSRRKDGETGD